MANLSDLTAKSYRILFYDEIEEYESTIQTLTEHLIANPADGIAYNTRDLRIQKLERARRHCSTLRRRLRSPQATLTLL